MEEVLTPDIRQQIEAYYPRYPTREAVILPALHVIQEALGYVPPKAVEELAQMLGLPPSTVQDTLSFYGFFAQDKPVGRTRLWVCRSLSCAARGGEELLDYLCQRLGIQPGQTTPDGRITLEVAECIGACDHAPAILAGRVLWKNMTKEKIDQMLESLP
ncbi:MAG: NAD(P)H-dependent oxidoreductase subunit E [Thermoguttaceae bacterium]|nr:NAD(P)H-dependent oxidoreductase subunit E [Thermoguttaceae bacterium]MDW8037420.1 NAD(P)H-dependent oxidoreductase subunit E [Thermoguttaceae bacterium]